MPEFFPQLAGLATIAFPFSKVKTSFGQNSTQRGFPSFAHPSHLSEKIIGNHGSFGFTKLFPSLLGFFQFPYYFSCLCFRGMRDSTGRALLFAARAEHDAVVKIFDHRPLFPFFFFEFVRPEFAVVYAFSAMRAFFIVNCWTPRYLASRNFVVRFLRQLDLFTVFVDDYILLNL